MSKLIKHEIKSPILDYFKLKNAQYNNVLVILLILISFQLRVDKQQIQNASRIY